MLSGPNASFYATAMRNEVDILTRVTQVKHPNIIAFKEYFEDDTQLYLIMEVASGGELFDRIQSRGRYSEADAHIVIRQMVLAVQQVHALDIVHADLKPDNFLFSDAGEHATLKMIDFGQAQRVRSRQLLHQIAGTPFYMAPELVTHQYNKSCDMWSVGVLMYVLLYGYPPFYADDDRRIFQLIRGGFNPKTLPGYGPWFKNDIRVSDSAKDLISKLLKTDVAARLTATEALEHPWLTGAEAPTWPVDESVLAGLRDFNQSSKFKQAVCWLMANDIASELDEWMQNGVFSQVRFSFSDTNF
jgi:calcium-dependent protein kinase